MAEAPRLPRELVARDRSKSVLTSSMLLVETNVNRVWLALVNKGTNDVFLRLGGAAVADTGIYLKANGGSMLLDMVLTPWYGEVRAIAITAASIVTCQEVELKV